VQEQHINETAQLSVITGLEAQTQLTTDLAEESLIESPPLRYPFCDRALDRLAAVNDDRHSAGWVLNRGSAAAGFRNSLSARAMGFEAATPGPGPGIRRANAVLTSTYNAVFGRERGLQLVGNPLSTRQQVATT